MSCIRFCAESLLPLTLFCLTKMNTMARIPITTGIPIPSAMPRLSFAPVERPFEAGDGEDEEVGDCVAEDNVVAEGKVVAGEVVAEGDPD